MSKRNPGRLVVLMDSYRNRIVRDAIRSTKGNIAEAARLLGCSRSSVDSYLNQAKRKTAIVRVNGVSGGASILESRVDGVCTLKNIVTGYVEAVPEHIFNTWLIEGIISIVEES